MAELFCMESFAKQLKSVDDTETKGSLVLTMRLNGLDDEESKKRIVDNFDTMKRVLEARTLEEIADIPLSKIVELIDDISIYGDVLGDERKAHGYYCSIRDRIKKFKTSRRIL